MADEKAWRCSVCGYIHRGAEPPELCPVCGAPREDFEPYAEEAPAAPTADISRYRCVNCSYVHESPEPPPQCPVCGAAQDRFEPWAETSAQGIAGEKGGKIVIVGAGIAGISALESVKATAPDAEVILVSKEDALPYYRLNLTRYLAGEVAQAELPIHDEEWYAKRNVTVLRDAEVEALKLDDKTVTLLDGTGESFDKLILTNGSHPFVPPIPGANRRGVTTFRTIADAERILEAGSAAIRYVVIGGGILGLETAGALARRGADVTLLEGHGWLLPRQLNKKAGRLLEQAALDLGIRVCHECRTDEILGDERVRCVRLVEDTVLPAELVIITTGVRPNSYLARLSGLEVNKGILVNDYLTSSHPDVFAAGDVAEHRGTLYGLWIPAMSQGSIAGMNAAGERTEFGGVPRSNVLKVLGVDLFSIGKVEPEDASYEIVEQELDGKYYRFMFRDSVMAGGILLGDTSETALVKRALEGKVDFSGVLKCQPKAVDIVEYLIEKFD